MERFAKRLRQRARELELSDAEVARRAGLAERRYGHYVRGAREPDFETLLRICAVLDVTPNDLLLHQHDAPVAGEHDHWISRLIAAARGLQTDDLRLVTHQIEAVLAYRTTD